MPGSGKSTIGVVLAKILGYRFLDSDLLIQEKTGKLLWEIIDECGNDALLEIENRINSEITADKTVIAPGGSVVHCREAMEHLRKISTVVYLRLPYDTVAERLGNFDKRGVTIKKGGTLLDLYNERTPLYESMAHIIFDCEGLTVSEAAIGIAEATADE